MLYIGLAVITLILIAFSIAWFFSAELRKKLEEPKYTILESSERE